MMSLSGFLIGRRLANDEAGSRKLTVPAGVSAMGLDGLSSSAYGPEAALTMLMPIGAAALHVITPIMAAILVLLALLFVSYWQTIKAYPNNGGSYTVASENLGANAGLLAATALMIDYVLNVAVGIWAGIGALTSAIPQLYPYTLSLCPAVLGLITIVNLRGTMEAGLLLSVTTYLFIASLGGVLILGLIKTLVAGGSPAPVVRLPPLPAATEAVTLWLLLRTFASGCTAMTGVEAVSNGISAFREPTVKRGHMTMATIVLILGVLLGAIAYLAQVYGIGAMDQTQVPERAVPAHRRSCWARRILFCHDRQRAGGFVPFGQYQLCRFSAAVPACRPGRLSSASVRHARTTPRLLGRHSMAGYRRGIAVDRL
jgi:amino acid transporter